MRRRGSQFLVFKCVTALAFALMAALFVPCVSYAQVSVQPQAFVPNWDGENDTTHVTWSMQQAALVRVIVVDKDSGKIHRVLVDKQMMEAGLHETWWDGRDQSGKVMAAKNWLIKVEGASDTSSTDTIQSANSGELSDINSAIVTLKEAPVSIRSIRMSNAFIGTATHNSRIVGKFSVSASSNVASVVIDSSGRIVRSFQTKVVNAGDTSLTWDGKSSRGRNVQDGNYTLLVAASGLGRPSNTLRMPIRIDRHVPKMMLARSIRAEVSRTNVVVPINFRVNENATMVVSFGGKKVSWKHDPKVKIVKLNGSSLGLRPAKSMKRVNLIVRAMDSSKNVTSKKVLLVIPPMQRSNRSVKPISKPVITPTTETDTSTDTVPTPSVGKLRWPVSGPVTSNFGLREGRMHQGIDIGVPTGTEVHAVLAGVVESAGTMDGYGIQVTLIHSNGLSTRYAHLSKIALGLVAGDQVSTGQVIGSSGCTGRCFGDHLHFETRINQIAENPLVRLS